MVSGKCSGCSAAITPKPSTSGIWMSRKTRSGFSRLMSAMADLPSPHSATISKSGSSSSNLRRRSRASDSSSLSNTRMGMIDTDLLRTLAERNVDLDDAASAGRIFQGHLVVVVVKLLQASARVAQADSFWRDRAETGKSLAVVADLDPQLVEDLARRDANAAGSAARADAVANGVLHQRLQEQVRHQRRQSAGLNIHLHLQPVVEARLLNVNVLLQEGQLAAERKFVDADSIQREAQQVRQLQGHVLGGEAIVAGQRGDGIQGVEQEVRLKLDLQHLKLCVRELRFQLRRPQFALLILAVVGNRLRNQHDVPVALEVHERARKSVREERNVLFRRPGDHRIEPRNDSGGKEGQRYARNQMDWQCRGPTVAVKAKALSELVHHRREHGPDKGNRDAPGKQLRPAFRAATVGHIDVPARCAQQSEHGPQNETDGPDADPLFPHGELPDSCVKPQKTKTSCTDKLIDVQHRQRFP